MTTMEHTTRPRDDGDIAAVMEEMPYGVYIVGSADAAGEPNGMMADWVMQVSFHPRLLAISFEQDAHTLANIKANGAFIVNFLPEDEEGRHLAAKFAQPYFGAKVSGRTAGETAVVHRKLRGISYVAAGPGCPILTGASAWLECKSVQFVAAGDHTVVIGEVVDGQRVREATPLTSLYSGWAYSG